MEGRNLKDFVAENELDCTDLAQEVSVEKNFSVCGLETVLVVFR